MGKNLVLTPLKISSFLTILSSFLIIFSYLTIFSYGKNILHFGGGQTEAVLSLSPGKYVLQLALGDYEHTPVKPINTSSNRVPLVSKKINIEITSD